MEPVENIKESILSSSIKEGQSRRLVCPGCAPDRKKQGQRTLSVTVDGTRALYFCHHCEAKGSVLLKEAGSLSVAPASTSELTDRQLDWLLSRGISPETAERCGLISGEVHLRGRGMGRCLGFSYKNADETTAIKWRDGAKNFTQTGAARSLWRLGEFTGGDLVICEGEMDALAFEEVGVFATSVPNGAPAVAIKDPGSATRKFSYLWDAKDTLESAEKIILATDADSPGKVLAEEIARRVGRARCWKVAYPEGCKDPNDVLIRYGKDGMADLLSSATPWPVSGLRNASEYRDEAMDLLINGIDRGVKVGLVELDNIFKPTPQTLTICTGIPGSGKSAFLSWVTVQLATNAGWGAAILSAETSTQIHILQLAALYCQKPFIGVNKMTEQELSKALDWIEQRFFFLDESDTEIDSVLERAQAAVLRHGVRVLVIDPYNFLVGSTVSKSDNQVETINRLLVSLKSFAVQYSIAVFLVAHPVKQYRGNDGGAAPVPTGYSISGSASFYNLADSGITVTRTGDGKSLVTSWKARFPWIGSCGEAKLDYDPEIGTFSSRTRNERVYDEDLEFDRL